MRARVWNAGSERAQVLTLGGYPTRARVFDPVAIATGKRRDFYFGCACAPIARHAVSLVDWVGLQWCTRPTRCFPSPYAQSDPCCPALLKPLPSEPFFGCLSVERACAAIERSLTPDPARGLPVWEQDIRWSLLGFALERGGHIDTEEARDERGLQLPSYLDWMEVELQVTMQIQPTVSPVYEVYTLRLNAVLPMLRNRFIFHAFYKVPSIPLRISTGCPFCADVFVVHIEPPPGPIQLPLATEDRGQGCALDTNVPDEEVSRYFVCSFIRACAIWFLRTLNRDFYTQNPHARFLRPPAPPSINRQSRCA